MQCHECGRAIEVGDRFCTGCGVSLAGVSEVTEAVPVVTPPDQPTGDQPTDQPSDQPTADIVETSQLPATELVDRIGGGRWDDDPVWAATGAVPAIDEPATPMSSPLATGELPSTEPITEVWMEQAEPETDPWTEVHTDVVPATAQMPAAVPAATAAPGRRFRFTAVTLLGVLGGVVLLVAMFATVVEITSNNRLTIGDEAPPSFRLGNWIADDLGSNLSVAGLLAALLMVVGGVAASFGWRWGSGMAGGGGLAAAGLAALVIGLAQYPIDAAHEFATIPTDQQFTLTITKALG